MLQLKEQASLSQIDQVIKTSFLDDVSGHDYEHIKRVVGYTTLFLKEVEDVDAFVTLAIAYLHDVFDHKIQKVDNVELAMLQYLNSLDIDFFGKEAIIAKGCSEIGYSIQKNLKSKLPESRLVSDADYLDAIGPYGVIRTIQYGILNHHNVDVMMQHIPEKLLKLSDLMSCSKAKELAAPRHDLLVQFYQIYNDTNELIK